MDLAEKIAKLNQEQQRAVRTTEGTVLILAGAGSGKTSVLTHRMAYLIENKFALPEEILGLTFTNKAAYEMKERIANLTSKGMAKKITLCTFHSFCMQVLRKEIHNLGYTKDFSLYDERDVKRLLNQLSAQILEQNKNLPSLEKTITKISSMKMQAEPSVDTNRWHDKFTLELMQRLKTCMRAYNAVDFDSLLSLTVELFEQHPQVLERYQNTYRYIMIDEYQDTNEIQYRLAALLSKKHRNLCVVGDDDQSIYSWRGALIKNILQFEAAHVIKLEQNYRSTPLILKAANAVIRNNHERHDKTLWSAHTAGNPIVLFHAPDEIEEAKAVVERIAALKRDHGYHWKDIAILYRSNILAQPLELALMQSVWNKDGKWIRGIPYEIFGGLEFYERSEIKDILAYLKVIVNPKDQEALLRIINVPRRGISDQTLDRLTQINRKNNIPLWEILTSIKHYSTSDQEEKKLSDKSILAIEQFTQMISSLQTTFQSKPLHEALKEMVETVHYQEAIEQDVKSEKMRQFKQENVAHFISHLEQYVQQSDQHEVSLASFVSDTLLDGDPWKKNPHHFSDDKVKLMTFHGSKGLEFPACFLIGLEDHIIPHEKSVEENKIEEERRLMYVAMTRAKEHLILSLSQKRKRMGKLTAGSPSRFLFEIPKELLKISSYKTIY